MISCNRSLTAEKLRQVLDYDPHTGIFTWKVLRGGMNPGSIAGCFDKVGYLMIKIDNRKYYGHRLAWLHFYGKWPTNEIDHKNCIQKDNRIENLRDVTKSENTQNQRKAHRNNSTGLLGAFKNGNRFASKIKINGKQVYLGTFKTAKEAHDCYLIIKRKFHKGNLL